MEKKDILIIAEQYLRKNLLYGTISERRVKDFLETEFLSHIKDSWGPEELARIIEEKMVNINTGEDLYVSAVDSFKVPLANVSNSDKKEYIETFLSRLPYKGDIKTTHDTSINIEEYFRNIDINSMDDNYNIIYDNLPSKSLKDVYRMLLDSLLQENILKLLLRLL